MKDVLEQISKRNKRRITRNELLVILLMLVGCSIISVSLVHLLMLASAAK